MKAMIFAAGEGRRMRPLTLTTPKPLLKAGGCSLLEQQLKKCLAAGIDEFVINVSYLGEQIESALADMALPWRSLEISVEPQPLETGGGLNRALPLLGDEPFVLLNADVWTDYPLANLSAFALPEASLAHLILVPNPGFKSRGDFYLDKSGRVSALPERLQAADGPGWTFSGLSLMRPELISGFSGRREIFPLREALLEAMLAGRVSAEVYRGTWHDIGTPERLAQLRTELQRGEPGE
ncbi:nucleotidyltransferase family protein [Agaribacterium haliotis]|uniref:nucleotidyltransferase family protein n=1 Tax=Agaribacterium haliotis TaxID=2013869 RepID=UPI000BB5756E|nr:nucleotidyltransferase family protein [Agaribacterium haliotis]